MKIGIVGLGIIGKANSRGFKFLKHKVVSHDIAIKSKIENLINSEIIYICVPTPSKKNGSCDTNIVESVILELININFSGIIAIRSTVEPGFTEKMINKYKNKKICFVPEFLRERAAYKDFIDNHNLCLVGTKNKKVYKKVIKSHEGLAKNFVMLKPNEAELVKYFSNVYAALKITFANNMFEIAKKMKCNYKKIKNTYMYMGRSKDVYLDANKNLRGYAGVCLPKDTKAIIYLIKKKNINLDLIKTIEKDNNKLKKTIFKGMRKS
jgi:UDPglucose 6-dehydrogenase